MLSKETAERWLLCLESLDRMVRKSSAHFDYGTIPPDEDREKGDYPGPPMRDADFHRLFEYVEFKIRKDCAAELPKIRLNAHDYGAGHE